MAYGGLRGAVGFSLVTILDNDHPFKAIFVTATLTMIFFTVFLQGGTIKFFVSKLHIQRKSHVSRMKQVAFINDLQIKSGPFAYCT